MLGPRLCDVTSDHRSLFSSQESTHRFCQQPIDFSSVFSPPLCRSCLSEAHPAETTLTYFLDDKNIYQRSKIGAEKLSQAIPLRSMLLGHGDLYGFIMQNSASGFIFYKSSSDSSALVHTTPSLYLVLYTVYLYSNTHQVLFI